MFFIWIKHSVLSVFNYRYHVNLYRRLLILMVVIIGAVFAICADDVTGDKNVIKKIAPFLDENYIPDENLKKQPLIFDMGGMILTKSRIMFKTFQAPASGGFEPVPTDRWYADLTGKIWGRMTFEEHKFIHLGVVALVKAEKNSIVPLFNVEELYLNWNYSIGRVVVGRTNYNLKSALVFSGPLDGVEININVPYLDFKTFAGFTGFLGVFNPHFNPYNVTSLDGSFREDTNLIYSTMVLKFNADQARRIFFATDFDIHFFGQHINPYFLLQYDLSSIFYNLNMDYDLNTFHLGLNFEGRIVKNLYYMINLAGLFGTHPASTSGQVTPILGCALLTQLRYTVPQAGHSTFFLNYSLGTGNSEGVGKWSDYAGDVAKGFWSDKYDGSFQNKFYYYGKFDGGYVLNPVLSNIHSLSVKYVVSPYKKGASQFSLYLAFYQTFKLYSTGSISDDDADLNDYIVGSEIDAGMFVNVGSHFNLGWDFGLYIPETAYSDKSLKFKMGATLAFSF